MSTPQPPSLIWNNQVDPPVQLDAGYQFDKNDRQYIDSQIRGLETKVVASVLPGAPLSIALTSGSNLALSAGQYGSAILVFTGTLAGVSTAVTLPTGVRSAWIMDFIGITFSGFTIQVQVGTNAKVLDVTAQHIYRVYSDGVGSLYYTQYS